MATYCKPRAILIKEKADELLVVVTMSFQLDKQKITFNHMLPEKDFSLYFSTSNKGQNIMISYKKKRSFLFQIFLI